jgi:hypothetical protein
MSKLLVQLDAFKSREIVTISRHLWLSPTRIYPPAYGELLSSSSRCRSCRQLLTTWPLREPEGARVLACRCTTAVFQLPWTPELLFKHWRGVVSIRRRVEIQISDPRRN